MTQDEIKKTLSYHLEMVSRADGADARIILNNRYIVSSIGNIYSVVASSGQALRANPYKLKPRITRNGYHVVYLSDGLSRKNYLVHRLVAGAFMSLHGGQVVHHLNSIKTDNNLGNLIITSHGENQMLATVVRASNVSKFRQALTRYTGQAV